MFVVSVKMSTLKIACVLAALGVVIAFAVWPRGDVQPSVAAGRTVAGISTNEKRIDFLQSYGWKVDAQPVEVVEVTIPQTFNQVYQNYNEIQKKQGFDLAKFRGKRVKRWTYNITNYPGYSQRVYGNLLIYDNSVIGGDVSTVALNGFMHGFAAPGASAGVSNPVLTIHPSAAQIVSGVTDISEKQDS